MKIQIHCDLQTLVRAAYDLSHPDASGIAHFKPGPLDGADMPESVAEAEQVQDYALLIPSINGRQTELHVTKAEGKLWINTVWRGHSAQQMDSLIAACTIRATA